jgi:hypothetical protein
MVLVEKIWNGREKKIDSNGIDPFFFLRGGNRKPNRQRGLGYRFTGQDP